MQRHPAALIGLSIWLAVSVVGCATISQPASPAAGRTITDALGRDVSLPEAPQRIVLTGKALFMIADAAYLFPTAPDRIVGLATTAQSSGDFISLIDPRYEEKATLKPDAGAEQVAALRPDLVIMKSYLAASVGAPIETLGIPVIYLDFETPEQYARDLAVLGQVFDDEARAAEIAAFYQSRVERIQQTVSGADEPRALLLYYDDRDGNSAFNVPPADWMQTRIMQMAGGDPVWVSANLSDGWTQVTLEQIAAWDPDQVYVASYFSSPEEIVAGLRIDPNWQGLRAVQDGQLYAFPGDMYSWDQPDPRWILGLTWLAGKLHPDLFPELDMLAEAQEFYHSLYGLDAEAFEQTIQPRLTGDLF